ncbi:dihydropteroate synthase [Nitrosomonas sp. ANs5]|uniref:dihydropteroate synthase n=1 Tax=Nitrosomonas sp. ANs5 TaxID=3423941 RepID=UPI003D34ABF9
MNTLTQMLVSDRPLIMGVLNVTPDSFSDGGQYATTDQAIQHVNRLIVEGADMLDIGGESTRPGSQPVSLEEELSRVIPVIEFAVHKRIPVSIDTSKPAVMRAAIRAGADLVNDVNALQAPGALEAIAENSAMVCLMHMQGTPETMQNTPHYSDVVTEVQAFLAQRIDAARNAGIPAERILIDPGFGFGKTLEHNLTLLQQLDRLLALGCPILVGLSRKSMLGAITGNTVDSRLHASVAAALLAVIKGAKIVRVHDVKATRDALSVLEAVI